MSLQAVAGNQPCHQATAIRLLTDSLYESTRGSTALTNQTQNELGLLLGRLSATEAYTSSLGAECVHYTVLKKRLQTCHVILGELQKLVLHPDTLGAQSLISDIRARLSSVICGLDEVNLNMMISSQKIIENALKRFVDEIRADKRNGSVVSDILKDSSKLEEIKAWTRLQGELVATGIASDLLTLTRDFVISTLQKIIQTDGPLPVNNGNTAPVEEVCGSTAPAPTLELERQRSLDEDDWLSDEPAGLPFLPLPPKGFSFLDKRRSYSSQAQPYLGKETIREDFPIPERLDIQDCTDTQKQALPVDDFPIPVMLDMHDSTDTQKQALPVDDFPIPVMLDMHDTDTQKQALPVDDFPIPVMLDMHDTDTQKQALPVDDFPIPVMLDMHDSTDTQKQALPIENFPIPASTETTLQYTDMHLPEPVTVPIEKQKRTFNPSIDLHPFKVPIRSKKSHRMSRMLRDMLWDPNGPKETFIAAVKANQHQMVQTLLSKGTDANTQNTDGQTALMAAVSFGHEPITRLLLEYGANMNIQAMKGETALAIAAARGHDRIVRILIASGASVDVGKGVSKTALSQAATYGEDRIVELLLDCGADIDAVNNTGETALALAALNGNMRVARLLLDRRAAVDLMRYPWQTPLCNAVQSDEAEMVRLLVQHGADPFLKVGIGRKKTVFAIAKDTGRRQILEIFEQLGYHSGGQVRYQYF
ncbi:hypothetical protein N7447_010832 [Penicillium robsamsonii]|uniref:uncharacterized protein n=1 Tax=Penicillium robsamsonii TaxID=1792511 RepID=UPI002548995D|nr:uncharacterized protein N7447_010832 [Penicillium robsamsonii]KAJ5807376.1 hypothetical protein N7447_010832 [Penicillium robsamsonii]